MSNSEILQPLPTYKSDIEVLYRSASPSQQTPSLESFLEDYSLKWFHINSPFRRFCIKLVTSSWFDWGMLFIILLSLIPLMFFSQSITAEFERPLFFVDVFFILVFAAELFVRVVALGLYSSKKSFLRDPFNCLDFIVVLLSLLAFTPLFRTSPMALRLLRVLRPLRSLHAVPPLKKVARSLFLIFPAVGPVLLFLFFATSLFAVFGVHILKGSFRNRCVPLSISDLPITDIINTYDWEELFSFCSLSGLGSTCEASEVCLGGFPNPEEGLVSFDNVFYSFLVIFFNITLEGWSHVTSWGWLTEGFVGFLFVFLSSIIGAFYVLNLFTAVVASKYGEINEKEEVYLIKSDLDGQQITIKATEYSKRLFAKTVETQTEEEELAAMEVDMLETITTPLVQRFCDRLSSHVVFEVFSTIFVIANIIALSLVHKGMSDRLGEVLVLFNRFLTIMFTFEVLIRCIAVGGLKKFVKNSFFDGFDIVIVTLSLVELALSHYRTDTRSVGFSVMRAMRLGRVLRVLSLSRSWRSLHRLLATLVASFSSILPFLTILVVFLFVFSAFGVEIFDRDKVLDWSNDHDEPFFFLNFKESLVSTFLLSTGENWNDLLVEVYEYSKSLFLTSAFFIASIVVFSFLLMNLLVGIIVDNFVGAREEEQRQHKITQFNYLKVNDLDSPRNQKSVSVKKEVSVSDIFSTRTVDLTDPNLVAKYSFFVIPVDNKFRKFCCKIVSAPSFSYVSYLVVFLSCISLALDQPEVDYNHWSREFSRTSSKVYSIIFLIELFISITAKSAFGPKGMFKTPFLAFDSVVILLSGIDFFFAPGPLLSAVRSFRALRPLRLLSLNKSGRLVTAALFQAFPAIFNAVLLFFIFILVFAIIGVQLFSDYPTFMDEYGAYIGFDNTARSMLSLFGFTTQEYLPTAFRHYVDSFPSALFFILYMIFGFWIITNVFISLMTEEFSDSASKIRDALGETDEKRRAMMVVDALKRIICTPCRPRNDSSWFKKLCFIMTHHRYFDRIVFTLIGFNSIVLASYHADMSENLIQNFRTVNNVFTILFALEILIKFLASGHLFWTDGWNIFDLILVIGSLISFISNFKFAFILLLFRLLRVLRIIRLSKHMSSIKKILRTTAIALPALGGIAVVSSIAFFVFSIFGMKLFGDLPVGIVELGLDEPIMTFRNFPNAMFIMITAASGEEWQSLMISSALCPDHPNSDCHGTLISTVFFVVFVFICRFIFLNLVSAAIVDAFVTAQKDLMAVVTPHDVQDFHDTWVSMDQDGLGFIEVSQLSQLFCALKPPLSPGKNVEIVNNVLRCLDVPVYVKKNEPAVFYVCFYDLLPSVIYRLLGPVIQEILPQVEITKIHSERKKVRLKRKFDFEQVPMVVREMFAASFIHNKWKQAAARRRQQAEFQATCIEENQFISNLLNV
ncbi:hypothetical protein RCL1_006213 [Eukaryota sp. TZLM3-RCL]